MPVKKNRFFCFKEKKELVYNKKRNDHGIKFKNLEDNFHMYARLWDNKMLLNDSRDNWKLI